jgi:hypothetical protein
MFVGVLEMFALLDKHRCFLFPTASGRVNLLAVLKQPYFPGSYSTGRQARAWGDYVHLHGHASLFSASEIRSPILI